MEEEYVKCIRCGKYHLEFDSCNARYMQSQYEDRTQERLPKIDWPRNRVPTEGMVTVDIYKSYGAHGALLQNDPSIRALTRLKMGRGF